MPKKPVQQIPIRQSRGGSGGGSPASLAQVAIGNFINDQSAAQKKMFDNFGKLQEVQAAEAAESSRQQTAAMNRVAAQEDEKTRREERLQEKQGDREFQDQHAEFIQNLQVQATKDFTAVQTRVAQQRKAQETFVTRMDQHRNESEDSIKAMRQRIHDPSLTDFWNHTPGGREKLAALSKNLRLAELYHEQDNQGRYIGESQQKFAEVENHIRAGEDFDDLSPLAKLSPPSLLGADFSDDDLEELYHAGGFVPGGIYGRDPDDPSVKKYKDFNPVDYDSTQWMIEDEQLFAFTDNKKMLDDYQVARFETFKDYKEILLSQQEFSNKNYLRLERNAVEATYFGVQGFMDDIVRDGVEAMTGEGIIKSGHFAGKTGVDAMALNLFEKLYVAIAGPGSEDQLGVLDKLANGKGPGGILDVEEELMMGFQLRNVMRHMDNNVMGMSPAPAAMKEGELSSSFQMARFISELPASEAKDQLARFLLMVPGDVSRGRLLQPPRVAGITGRMVYDAEMEGLLHSGVERMLKNTQLIATDMMDMVNAQPALLAYRRGQGSTQRYLDAGIAAWFSRHPDEDPTDEGTRHRALREGRTKDFRAGLEEPGADEAIEGFTAERLAAKLSVGLSPMQAWAELTGEHTSSPEMITAVFSADFDRSPPVLFEEGDTTEEMRAKLKVATERSAGRRAGVAVEMKRRREAHAKKQSLPGESEPGQQIPLGASQDEPSEN